MSCKRLGLLVLPLLCANLTLLGALAQEGPGNLRPFTPPGWSGPLVVSVIEGTNADTPAIDSRSTLFVDWAVENSGAASIDQAFSVTLFIDGETAASWRIEPPLAAGDFASMQDFPLEPLNAGTRLLELRIDSSDEVEESDEQDNAFEKRLEINSPPPTREEEILLALPLAVDDSDTGTGFAFSNPTGSPAEIELRLIGNDGLLVRGEGVANPTELLVPAGGQAARTVAEIFGPAVAGADAWVQVRSKNIGVAAFFLNFTPGVGQIDGEEGLFLPDATPFLPNTTPDSIIPEVFSGDDAFTELAIVGVGPVNLDLYSQDGSLFDTAQFPLPFGRLGRLRVRVDEAFSGPIPDPSYILIRPQNFNAIGFESFGTGRARGGRNSLPVRGAPGHPKALFGAQVAFNPSIASSLTLINPSAGEANVTLSLFATGVSADRQPIASIDLSLGARGMMRRDARQLFGLEDEEFVGWLRADSDNSSLLGHVNFGDPEGEFLASVLLQDTPLTDCVFSHLADGLGFFTGLTFLNSSVDPTEVELEVFDREGVSRGNAAFTLDPFEHRARLISEIIPQLGPQIGGFIRVRSQTGIYLFELFSFAPGGPGNLESLAAVAPQRGFGTAAGRIELPDGLSPQQAIASLSQGQGEYRASRAKGATLAADSEFIPGEAVVRMLPSASSGSLAALRSGFRLKALSSGGGAHLFRSADIDSPTPGQLAALPRSRRDSLKRRTLDLIERLNSRPDVLFAEPNYLYRAARVPSDPLYARQWHLSGINMDRAWDISTGDAQVVVAVVDNGLRFAHPDLQGRVGGGQYDFVSDPRRALDGDGIDPSAEDPGQDIGLAISSYHGTHVAGIIGAGSDNALGVTGMNWNSPLMILRAMGAGAIATNFDAAQAVRYAAGLPNASGQLPQRPADLINLSMSGATPGQTLGQAIAEALAQGIAVIAAAGNENSNQPVYPASYDGVISVGAADLAGGRADYSNFGGRLDVLAPGGNTLRDQDNDGSVDGVLSAFWDRVSDQPSYELQQGTSMAAAHASGLASLMLSVNPDLSPADIRRLMSETAQDLGEQGRDDFNGFGLIDPLKALRAAGAPTPPIPLLAVSTETLNFGTFQSTLIVSLYNLGGGDLEVEAPIVERDQPGNWLFASLSDQVLEVQVIRTGLSNGKFSGRVILETNAGEATIEVLMEVGSVSINAGGVIVLALSPDTLEPAGATFTTLQRSNSYSTPPIESGDYIIVAGTDADDDGAVCDPGELCGFYPVGSRPTLVPIRPNQVTEGIFITIEQEGTPGQASSAGAAAVSIPPQGFAYPRRKAPPIVKAAVPASSNGGSP